jgi:sterol desaturase/sphingolipid hydroxylase (fatty acid hydroxylase superfamily)
VLIEPLQALDLPIGGIWPRELPIGVQVVLLILASDFLRYWLHRAAHTHPLLWRLHAVHHSPERLYWLNVGRFHPLEKALQLMAETVPFVLFGAPETVIAFHFVLYATNGFFQHCNIRLRYGWLNYLVAGAELHRWHHSRVPAESNRNFGNNVIVWDLLFGTWYLPQEREVGGLGLRNRRYPTSFPAQMRTPFVAGITDRDVSLRPLGDIMRGFTGIERLDSTLLSSPSAGPGMPETSAL